MTDKVSLVTIGSLQNESTALAQLNANSAAITAAMDNTLSRDGTSPNQMGSNFDMNSYSILNPGSMNMGGNVISNLGIPINPHDAARLVDIGTGSGGGGAVSSVFGRTGSVVATSGDYAVNQITGAAPLVSPAFTGSPTATALTINPASSTLNSGLTINQSGPTTGSTSGPLSFNTETISFGSTVTGSGSDSFGVGNAGVFGHRINFSIAGNNVGGGLVRGLGVVMPVNSTSSAFNDGVAIVASAIVNAALANTGTIEAMSANGIVSATGSVNRFTSFEAGTSIATGGSAVNRAGFLISSGGNVNASTLDAALVVSAVTTPYSNFIQFSGPNGWFGGSGIHAVATTGNLFTTDAAMTVANVFNFGSVTVTGNFWTLPNSSLTGAGALTTTASTVTNNQNSTSGFSVNNSSTGTASASVFIAVNSANFSSFGIGSTGYTSNLLFQNRAFINASSGSAGIAINNIGANPIIFGVSNAEVGRWDGTTAGQFDIGVSATLGGALLLYGSSSGSSIIKPPSTGGGTATLPAGSGTLAYTTTANVISVSNSDGTLTISPTTGAVTASLALGHANTWSGQQTFVTPILGTPASGTVTNLTGTASININGTVGVTTPTTGAFTTVVTSTSETVPTLFGGTATGSSLSLRSTSNGSPSGDFVNFLTGGVEFARYTSANYLIGSTTAYAVNSEAGSAFTPTIQQHSNGAAATFSITRWSANGNQGRLVFAKSNGAAVGTHSAVSTSYNLGTILFDGDDGTNFIPGAFITAQVNGTVATGQMPTQIQFGVSPASVANPAQAMLITSSAGVFIGSTNTDPGAGNLTVTNDISALRKFILPSYTVATLPAGAVGALAFITDATLTAITGLGLAPIGGGANKVVVYYDGAWKIL